MSALKKVSFIELSDIVPENWRTWFYCLLSENAPFSWGDNNRTLVTAERLHDHCVDRLEDVPQEIDDVNEMDVNNFLTKLEAFGTTYIDLEN
jgi:hypothetical protein